jgi:hypothetical protein
MEQPQSFYFGIGKHNGYIEHGCGWKCSVCGTSLSEAGLTKHARDTKHRDAVVKISAGATTYELLDKRTEIYKFERRLDRLGCTKWQLHVQGLLFRFLVTPRPSRARVTFTRTRKLDPCLPIEELLSKYEQMERLSLLELAVWKASCTIRAGEVEVDLSGVKTVEDVRSFSEKQRNSWKDYRAEMRHSYLIDIVITGVVPFVGKH